MWWHPHKYAARMAFLEQRALILRAVRVFFDEDGFLEVETPILQASPGCETHIHAFGTELLDHGLKPLRQIYLHTSPEFAMKKLLVAGLPKIYQVCHAFRNGEGSSRHSPEFTILEWYRAGATYRAVMDDCVNLLRHIAKAAGIKTYRYGGHESDPFKDWEIISVADAFQKYAGINLHEALEIEPMRVAVKAIGLRVTDGDTWDDLFFHVMAEKIEPKLGQPTPTILFDYPASMAPLSRKCANDPRYAERFEMYVCGLELCNAFGELTDAAEQRRRFESEMKAKQEIYGRQHPIDDDFIWALEYGMPEASGNALGFDRLVMLATCAGDIEQVLWCGMP